MFINIHGYWRIQLAALAALAGILSVAVLLG